MCLSTSIWTFLLVHSVSLKGFYIFGVMLDLFTPFYVNIVALKHKSGPCFSCAGHLSWAEELLWSSQGWVCRAENRTLLRAGHWAIRSAVQIVRTKNILINSSVFNTTLKSIFTFHYKATLPICARSSFKNESITMALEFCAIITWGHCPFNHARMILTNGSAWSGVNMYIHMHRLTKM